MNQDAKGRFVGGNQAANKGPEYKCLRAATKDEIMRAAFSLTQPWDTLNDDFENSEISRLGHLTSKAVERGNLFFIKWLLEMAVGRPAQSVEVEGTPALVSPSENNKDMEDRILNLVLDARRMKAEKDSKKKSNLQMIDE